VEFSLYGSSVRETWGGSFARGPKGYVRKALGMGISLHGTQLGNLELVYIPRTLIYG